MKLRMMNKSLVVNKKSSLLVVIWLLSLIILFISFFIVFKYYRFNTYETSLGYVKKIEDDYKIVTYLKKFDKLKNYNIILDNKTYEFEIESISEDYYIIDGSNYYEIIITMNLNDTYKINNNILNLKFEKEKTTIYKLIKEGIKSWIG